MNLPFSRASPRPPPTGTLSVTGCHDDVTVPGEGRGRRAGANGPVVRGRQRVLTTRRPSREPTDGVGADGHRTRLPGRDPSCPGPDREEWLEDPRPSMDGR